MKITQLLSAIIILVFTTSSTPSKDEASAVVGTYGSGSAVLQLNLDHSFSYFHACEDVEIKGEWTFDNGKVELSASADEASFPERWKLDKKYPCLRSEWHHFEQVRLCKE